MSKTVTTDGKSTTINNQGVTQTITDGQYHASSQLRSTTHSANGVVQSGSSRNVEITGNSQQCYAGRGLTSQYSMKVIGSPEMFSGKAQRAADKAVSKLAGLLLQPGDNRYQCDPAGLVSLDFTKITSRMTSGWSGSLMPAPPQISRIQDIPKLTAYMGAYLSTVSVENAAYQAAMAGALEIERQAMQKAETIKRLKKTFKEQSISGLLSGGLPSSEDKDAKPNVKRSDVYEAAMPTMSQLIAAEEQIC